MSSEQPAADRRPAEWLAIQRATMRAQNREWKAQAQLVHAMGPLAEARTGYLTAFGARLYHAFYMTDSEIMDLRSLECEHLWYITVVKPDGTSTWTWVNAAYIQQTLLFRATAGIMPLDNTGVIMPEAPEFSFHCRVRDLHRAYIDVQVTQRTYGSATQNLEPCRCSLLDYLGARKSKNLWFESAFEVNGENAIYTISGLAPAPISVELYIRVLGVISQHFTADPDEGEQQPRTRPNKSALRRALREEFPSHVLYFSFIPSIRRDFEGESAHINYDIQKRFLEHIDRGGL